MIFLGHKDFQHIGRVCIFRKLSKQLGISKELAQKLSDFYNVDPSLFIAEKPTGDGELDSLLRREAFLEKEIALEEKILKQAKIRKAALEKELAQVQQAIKDQ